MPRLKITVAYDGAAYAGWQVQAGQPSIQAAVQDAFARIQLGRIDVTGASRTDAGVHAAGQVCHVDVEDSAADTGRLIRSLNGVLPRDIRALEIVAVPTDFHARYDAQAKHYRYLLALGAAPPPLLRHAVWHHPAPLNTDNMIAATSAMVGQKDFQVFQAAGSDVEDTVRTMFDVQMRPFNVPGIAHSACGLWAIDICGDGFLYKMVRSFVGTLVAVGASGSGPELVSRALATGDRTLVGVTAPASALTLCHISYESASFNLPV